MTFARTIVDADFQARRETETPEQGDLRRAYQIDRSRLIHSSAFRRLQGKTQVMGAGEGDFHRTRLTHSIEVSQVGLGILQQLWTKPRPANCSTNWIPRDDLVLSTCLAHDLGHPPFGHGGEKALHQKMLSFGGFEGNGQTLRIISRLEKCRPNLGINPTRRLTLAVLKYPVAYSAFDATRHTKKPPKCYLDTEHEVVQWAMVPFSETDRSRFCTIGTDGKPAHRTLDASIMECADDIAYGVHDLEDIVARNLITREQLRNALSQDAVVENGYTIDEFEQKLFLQGSFVRRQFIEKLVWAMVRGTEWVEFKEFEHPLLRFRAGIRDVQRRLLDSLQDITYEQVVTKAAVQQLEQRGQRVVTSLFDELVQDPTRLIPKESWDALPAAASIERRVCDYVAGMTDAYAERIHRRLFSPGFGSSRDEL